jgi:hypothetical protein
MTISNEREPISRLDFAITELRERKTERKLKHRGLLKA